VASNGAASFYRDIHGYEMARLKKKIRWRRFPCDTLGDGGMVLAT